MSKSYWSSRFFLSPDWLKGNFIKVRWIGLSNPWTQPFQYTIKSIHIGNAKIAIKKTILAPKKKKNSYINVVVSKIFKS